MRLALIFVVACGGPPPPATTVAAELAICDVRVFDGARVREHQTVLVAHGRVVALDGADQLATARAAREVDGRGATLLPGLVDAHAHVNQDDDPVAALDAGVTTEIDMMSWAARHRRASTRRQRTSTTRGS